MLLEAFRMKRITEGSSRWPDLCLVTAALLGAQLLHLQLQPKLPAPPRRSDESAGTALRLPGKSPDASETRNIPCSRSP